MQKISRVAGRTVCRRWRQRHAFRFWVGRADVTAARASTRASGTRAMHGCERREAVWARSPEQTRTAAEGELWRAWGSFCARPAERGAPMKPPNRGYHRLGRRIRIVIAAIRFSGDSFFRGSRFSGGLSATQGHQKPPEGRLVPVRSSGLPPRWVQTSAQRSPSGQMAAAQSGEGRDAAHLRSKQFRCARASSSMSSRIAAGRIRGARYGADVRAASCVAVC